MSIHDKTRASPGLSLSLDYRPPEEVDHRGIDFLGPLLLRPVTAAGEHDRLPEVWDELLQPNGGNECTDGRWKMRRELALREAVRRADQLLCDTEAAGCMARIIHHNQF